MPSHTLSSQQSVRRTITPQLQEAIRLLEIPYEDLSPFIDKQLALNPFLKDPLEEGDVEKDLTDGEEDSPLRPLDNDGSAWEDTLAVPPVTLKEHLVSQANTLFTDTATQKMAHCIIDHLDPDGYLRVRKEALCQELGLSHTKLAALLTKLRQCEPSGVFAQSLSECLRLQLEEKGLWDRAYEDLFQYLVLFAEGAISQSALEKKCRLSPEELTQRWTVLRTLSPQPGLAFDHTALHSITPEVIVFFDVSANQWNAKLNNNLRTRLLFDEDYYQQIRIQTHTKSDRSYLSEKAGHAQWIQKALHQRNQTLLRVSREIIKQQEAFLTKGIGHLKPLILQNISSELGLHESTISRITTAKYMRTPQGLFELKFFFSSGFETRHGESVSSESIRNTLQKLIKQETADKPLSDCVLEKILRAQGLNVARRTIAKYRELLNIPPSFQRKRQNRLNKLRCSATKTEPEST